MVKKIRRMRTFAKTASKSLEKKLVENAKDLKKNPYLLLPDYKDNISKKYFGKLKKSLDKINRFNEDIKKLEKFSNKRGLEGAFAGTLQIANSEKAPYLAVAKFPTGDISYAQRGRAEKEKLIAVQHYDNPVLRLLGIKDIALKKKLHIYSWDEGYISTGFEALPPEEFIDFIIKKTNLKLKDGVATCKDIPIDVAKNGNICNENYLRIKWKSANTIFAICEDCAKTKKNTIFNITKYMIIPDISEDFEIKVIGQVVKEDNIDQMQTYSLDEYLSGKLTDIEFIKKNMNKREESIKESGEKILILDGVSFGTDVDKFVNALKPNKFEKEGLKIILEKIDEPVVLDDVTPNKVLEKFWKDYGSHVINSIIDDEEMTKKFFSLQDTPSEILKLVYNFNERQQILSQLPKYSSLPHISKFVDRVVRAYKTFGEKEAISEINKRPDNPKCKSIAYAFLLVFGKAKDKKWQYSQIEIEYGEFLKDIAKKLLESDPNSYHKNFKELLTVSGSSEDIDKNLVKS